MALAKEFCCIFFILTNFKAFVEAVKDMALARLENVDTPSIQIIQPEVSFTSALAPIMAAYNVAVCSLETSLVVKQEKQSHMNIGGTVVTVRGDSSDFFVHVKGEELSMT